MVGRSKAECLGTRQQGCGYRRGLGSAHGVMWAGG